MRRWLMAIAATGALVGALVAWPLYSVYQLGSAVRSADLDQALARIDIVFLRRSIVEQVVLEASHDDKVTKALNKAGGFIGQLALRAAAAEMDRRLAAAITPEMLRTLLLEGRLPITGNDGNFAPDIAAGNETSIIIPESPLSKLQSWGYSSPRKFKVVVGDDERKDDWTSFSLRLSGAKWKLSEIQLPKSILARIRPEITRLVDL